MAKARVSPRKKSQKVKPHQKPKVFDGVNIFPKFRDAHNPTSGEVERLMSVIGGVVKLVWKMNYRAGYKPWQTHLSELYSGLENTRMKLLDAVNAIRPALGYARRREAWDREWEKKDGEQMEEKRRAGNKRRREAQAGQGVRNG